LGFKEGEAGSTLVFFRSRCRDQDIE
jgi:hypothetical protein